MISALGDKEEVEMKEKNKAMVIASDTIPKNIVEAGTGTSLQVLIAPVSAPNFAMRCFTMEPGGGIPKHTNTVEHEQYVLGGRAQVGIGDEVHEVKKDDVLFIPAGVPHWYKVDGDEAFRFLCIVPNQPDKLEMVEEG